MAEFLPGVAEQMGFYVDVLIDPRNGRIFYVGKGTGERVTTTALCGCPEAKPTPFGDA